MNPKHLAHEWARRICKRPARATSSAVKLAAMVLADRARLVTSEVALEHGLPEEVVGCLAAWPSIAQLAEDLGQGSERTVRGYLQALGEDLVVVERRHLRVASIYLLAEGGRPVGSSRSGAPGQVSKLDTSEEPSTGRIQPVDRPVESSRSSRATGRIQPVDRPVGSRTLDRSDSAGPVKEEPIIEPIRSKQASWLARSLAALERDWDEFFHGRVGQHPPPGYADELRSLGPWMVEHLEEHGGTPEELSTRLVANFWKRPGLRRPPARWLAEDPVRYLGASAADAERVERAERERDAARAEREADRAEEAAAVSGAEARELWRPLLAPAPARCAALERRSEVADG